jgi:hypothetical protein
LKPDRPAWIAATVLTLLGCDQAMRTQPRPAPLAASSFFADGMSSRPPVEGTIARGHLRLDPHLHEGRVGGELADAFPFPLTRAILERGRERFDIYCSPCHDRTGSGGGMIVRRGFRAPPPLHDERLRAAPVGHLFDVITRGFGAMPEYAALIGPEDRWAIVAYVRALQLSQHAASGDLAPGEADRLERETR